jgi:hypothetical protein
MVSELSALYYPYPTIRNIETLKKTLLVFDHIYLIYPADYPPNLTIESASSPGSNSNSRQYLAEIMNSGIFKIISPENTVHQFRDFMHEELEKDKRDPKFQKEHARPGWKLFEEKVPESILDDPEFRPLRDNSGAIRLPFVQGESIMISHAICGWWANANQDNLISPITDERIHQKLLEHRIERARKTAEPAIQNEVSAFSIRKAIDLSLPEPPIDIEQIIRKRNEKSTTLRKIRECIKKIADIMQNPTDNFDMDISRLNEEIMIAYSELGQEYNAQRTAIRTHNWFNEILDRYSPGIGSSPGTAIGARINLLPSPGVGLLSSKNTTLTQKAYSDIEKLRNPIIGYRIQAK